MGLRKAVECGAGLHAAHLRMQEFLLVEEYERPERDGWLKQSHQREVQNVDGTIVDVSGTN